MARAREKSNKPSGAKKNMAINVKLNPAMVLYGFFPCISHEFAPCQAFLNSSKYDKGITKRKFTQVNPLITRIIESINITGYQ